MRQAAVLQAAQLVHTAGSKDRYGKDVRRARVLLGQPVSLASP